MTSGCFYESNFYVNYNNLLFAFALFLTAFSSCLWAIIDSYISKKFFCLLFTMELASCCLRLPLVSEINK